jgi:glutamine phosphoribosylpyrophosphate amidotransferase
MCGVVGFSCDNPSEEHYDLLAKLICESAIRGLHRFGISYTNPTFGIVTKKNHDLIALNIPKVNKLIFHNRYSTSGDYKDHKNNQPITYGKIALAFNGVIDMRTKEEMEAAYGIQMRTENDGEIVLQTCGSDKEKLKSFVENTTGSFAGLILTASNELLAIRNTNRPLWTCEYKDGVYFASTKDIFKRADSTLNPVEVKPYTIYES